MFQTMKVSTRLALGFGLVIALLIGLALFAVGGAGYWGFQAAGLEGFSAGIAAQRDREFVSRGPENVPPVRTLPIGPGIHRGDAPAGTLFVQPRLADGVCLVAPAQPIQAFGPDEPQPGGGFFLVFESVEIYQCTCRVVQPQLGQRPIDPADH